MNEVKGLFRCGQCGEDVADLIHAALADHDKSWNGRVYKVNLTMFEESCPECGADLCFVRTPTDDDDISVPDQCKGMFAMITLEA